jgi:site-specific recombinase XerD
MLQDMQLRGFSPNTQRTYLDHLRHFEKHFQKPAQQLGVDDLRNYLLHLITVKKVSGEYVDSSYSALKFFYENTLGREWDMKQIPRLKRTRKLPVVLSRNEIKQLLAVTTNLKFKAMFMSAYSAVSESVRLLI